MKNKILLILSYLILFASFNIGKAEEAKKYESEGITAPEIVTNEQIQEINIEEKIEVTTNDAQFTSEENIEENTVPEEKKENYIHSNINGFKKVVEFCVENSIKKLILSLFDGNGKLSFFNLISNLKNRLDIIISFLAILDLIRTKQILVFQKDVFSDLEFTILTIE